MQTYQGAVIKGLWRALDVPDFRRGVFSWVRNRTGIAAVSFIARQNTGKAALITVSRNI